MTALALGVLVSTAAAQSADPKSRFVQTLGQLGLALDGTYGDEGRDIVSNVEALASTLTEWDEAIRLYESEIPIAAQSDPRRAASMHVGLGGLHMDRGRYADAIREFDTALALEPRPETLTLRGLAGAAAHDGNGAALFFKRALEREPSNPIWAYLWGRMSVRGGQTSDAKTAWQAVARIQRESAPRAAAPPQFMQFDIVEERIGVEPFLPPAHYAEAFARLARGDLRAAVDQLRDAARTDALVTDPASASYAMRKAADAFRDGEVTSTVAHLRTAIELYPESSEPHRVLGVLLAADGQYEQSVDELRRALAKRPEDERARLALADVLIRSDQPAAAVVLLQQTIAAIPQSGRAHYMLARLHQRENRDAEALQEFQSAVNAHPLRGLNGLYQSIGAIAAARQNFDVAVDAYSTRIDLVPNAGDAHQDLGDTYSRLGRVDEALAEYAVALTLNPQNVAAYAGTAQIYLRTGQNDEAAAAARHAIELERSHRQARYTLGTALVRLGRTDEGTAELHEFERLQADDAAARAREIELWRLRREASLASAAGEHQKAVSLLRQVLEIAPNDVISHLDLGIALMLAGRPAEAAVQFKSTLDLNGPDDVHRRLAEAYAALGRTDESRHEMALFEASRRMRLQRAGAPR